MEETAGGTYNMTDEFIQPLLTWYDGNKRILPWRDKHNAYYTWVSEIMLQQTRVEAVKPYFERFIRELPDVPSLAACPQEKLLKLWEGLGYYSRVRNMQLAAQEMVEKYDGKLPEDFSLLLSLKGIGSYTAGAIASIAYGIPVPAVDGNVFRVVTRLTEDAEDVTRPAFRKKTETALQEIIPADRPGDFNQAMMELGAVVCVPNGQPKCLVCPVREFCQASLHGTMEKYPVKAPKKPRTLEERTVLVIQDGNCTAIRKRPSKGLLAGLYELPNIEGHLDRRQVLEYVEQLGAEPLYIEELPDAKHIFSHIEWRMKGYLIRVASFEETHIPGILFADKKESEKNYAIPSAFGAYVKYMKEEIQ